MGIWWIAFILIIGMGISLTVRLRGVQIRLLAGSLRHAFGKGADRGSGSISSAEAFFLSLGARVGVGNIAGIATAIFVGGPGAVMWMWIFALIGAASAFAETVLGQIFKERQTDGGLFAGGPAFYISKGLKSPRFALLAALLIITSYSVGFTASTAATACNAFTNVFRIDDGHVVFAIVMASVVGLSVAYGLRYTARISLYAVPVIAMIWLIICAVVI